MKRLSKIMLLLLAAACLLSALAGCGGSKASAMHLSKAEGDVSVADEAGAAVQLREQMSLHSGYQVATAMSSFAWIDLDKVKLTKMDENSQVAVNQSGKQLVLEVQSGSLFFNVTEPLAEDESLEIRTSSMAVGIRGTSGWVHASDQQNMQVYILEGTVQTSISLADGRVLTAEVNGGEMAQLTLDEQGEASIEVQSFSRGSVPAFVLDEVQQDEGLAAKIDSGSGLDLTGWDADAERRQALAGTVYFGDYNLCRLTPNQAEQMADMLEQTIGNSGLRQYYAASQIVGYSALIDQNTGANGGVPMLLAAIGVPEISYGDLEYTNMMGMETYLWQFENGQLNLVQSDLSFTPYQEYMLCVDQGGDSVSYTVYEYADGLMPQEPTTTAYMNSMYVQEIDGQAVGMDQLSEWLNKWVQDENVIHLSKSPGFDRVKGCQAAEGMIAALRAYAGGGTVAETPGASAEPPNPWRTTNMLILVDPNLHIERTILNMPGLNADVFFEIPVFEQSGGVYEQINGYFQSLRDDFFGPAGREELEGVWAMCLEPYRYGEEPYTHTKSASVTEYNDKYISVILAYDWYMGGVMDYGLDAYVFDAKSGQRLQIDDVIAGSETEIKDMIAAAMIELEPASANEPPDFTGETALSRMREHKLEDFDFYIKEGRVHVSFDKYEIAAGAAGAFDVELPAELNL